MSNVLKRIQENQRRKQAETPKDVSQGIVEQYLADLKEDTYEKAMMDLQNKLIQSANDAEIEGMQAKIVAMEIEKNAMGQLLSEAKSQVIQLDDLVKSLKAEIKTNSIAFEKQQGIVRDLEKAHQEKIHSLEMALIEAKKPAPIPQVIKQEPRPLPSFRFTPVRGPDGRTMHLTAEPI